jgi:hypothetical protein
LPESDSDSALAEWLGKLGLPTDLAPDQYAPTVDAELVRAYVRKDKGLTADERVMVLRLVARFRSWRQALLEALRLQAGRPG